MNVTNRLRELADKLERDTQGMTEGAGVVCHHWAVRAGRALRSEVKELPRELQRIVTKLESVDTRHEDATSNLVFLQAIQVWLGNRHMNYEDVPKNPSRKTELLVGRYAENMRELANALETADGRQSQAEDSDDVILESVKPDSGLVHPIFAVNDELRKNDTGNKWKRPAIAREYLRRLSGNERKAELERHGGDGKAMEKHFVDKLRNHKDKLFYP